MSPTFGLGGGRKGYKGHTWCELEDLCSLPYWPFGVSNSVCKKGVNKCLLCGCHDPSNVSFFWAWPGAEFTADNITAVYTMLCHQHLDSKDGKVLKDKLDVNLKTSCHWHTDHIIGCVPFVSLQNGAFKCPLCGSYVPSMCPFAEPELRL